MEKLNIAFIHLCYLAGWWWFRLYCLAPLLQLTDDLFHPISSVFGTLLCPFPKKRPEATVGTPQRKNKQQFSGKLNEGCLFYQPLSSGNFVNDNYEEKCSSTTFFHNWWWVKKKKKKPLIKLWRTLSFIFIDKMRPDWNISGGLSDIQSAWKTMTKSKNAVKINTASPSFNNLPEICVLKQWMYVNVHPWRQILEVLNSYVC